MELPEETHLITEEAVRAFRSALEQREYSHGSIENYTRSLRAFIRWNGCRVGKPQVAAWKLHLSQRCAAATVNVMLAGLNRFFILQGWEDCRVKPLRLQRRCFLDPERELSREEYLALVRTARAQGKARLALAMETLCATGIRVSEICYITVEAARRGRAEIALKGKVRVILLPGKLCRRLLRYAADAGIASGPVFRTGTGRPLGRVQLWTEMKRLCPAAGVPAGKVFPHNLRHLFARSYYQLCRDVVQLADVLGHSSMETTRIYLRSAGTEHIRQLERLRLLC